MTKDEIIAMAKEAGFSIGKLDTLNGSRPLVKHVGFDCYAELMKFANLLLVRDVESAPTEFSKFELVHMASQAGMVPISYNKTAFDTEVSAYTPDLSRFAALVAAKAAADERERLFGKERDGDMRLMLHRWDQGRCWAAVTHFTAEQTRFGPSGVLDRTAERMSAEMDAAIRARSPQ